MNKQLKQAVLAGESNKVTTLLQQGANIEANLLLTAQKGHTEVVNALLAAKADKEAKDNKGATALMLAALNGHTGVVKLLLQKKGANIDDQDNYGRTALMLATNCGHTEGAIGS